MASASRAPSRSTDFLRIVSERSLFVLNITAFLRPRRDSKRKGAQGGRARRGAVVAGDGANGSGRERLTDTPGRRNSTRVAASGETGQRATRQRGRVHEGRVDAAEVEVRRGVRRSGE